MFKFICALLLVTGSCFAIELPAPTPEKTPPPQIEVPPASLTQEEVQYIKRQFRNALMNDVINVMLVPENDKNSGALTRINHPVANKVSMTVLAALFKDDADFEKQLFDSVYKDADARNKVRVWDVTGEVNFLRVKLDPKMADQKFVDELLAAFKELEKKK